MYFQTLNNYTKHLHVSSRIYTSMIMLQCTLYLTYNVTQLLIYFFLNMDEYIDTIISIYIYYI